MQLERSLVSKDTFLKFSTVVRGASNVLYAFFIDSEDLTIRTINFNYQADNGPPNVSHTSVLPFICQQI